MAEGRERVLDCLERNTVSGDKMSSFVSEETKGEYGW